MQVGLAGPSGSGKTAFSEKIRSFIPSCALLSMDNYNDGTKVIDGNFDGEAAVCQREGRQAAGGRPRRTRHAARGAHHPALDPFPPPADPRITDYDTLLANIKDLKEGRPAQVRQHLASRCAGFLHAVVVVSPYHPR